jgi:hypothetical protein
MKESIKKSSRCFRITVFGLVNYCGTRSTPLREALEHYLMRVEYLWHKAAVRSRHGEAWQELVSYVMTKLPPLTLGKQPRYPQPQATGHQIAVPPVEARTEGVPIRPNLTSPATLGGERCKDIC